jgi:diguanylate cyclase (GGDEF)-like protein
MRTSWLFPDGIERERMLDMDRRLRPVRRASFVVLGVALVASGPWLGWWTLVPLAAAAVVFNVVEKRIDGLERPELALFGAWAASQLIIAIAVALSGGPSVATMSWFAIPLTTLSARFSERGTALGVGITLALMLAVAFGVDASGVIADPPLLIAPVALVVTVAMFQVVMMRSDVDTRAQAVVDDLTGLLNRKALYSRVAELGEQSRITGEPVGLIVGDVDAFKSVNDEFGHPTGDIVLRELAYLLRKVLRAFDLVYRLGGEEFVVIVPGADLEQAAELAESLRVAVESDRVGGHDVTMSFGVSASVRGAAFGYESLFARADRALYRAKQEGRNRVCRSDDATALAVPA